jgi:hypothetical protein
MKKMVLKTKTGWPLKQEPKYDSRKSAASILGLINTGRIPIDKMAASIHWVCRGYLYSAVRGVTGMFIFDGIPAKVVR